MFASAYAEAIGSCRSRRRLEYFTISWNIIEGTVAIGAGIAGSVALVGFGVDSSTEVISAIGLRWRLRTAGPEATVAGGRWSRAPAGWPWQPGQLALAGCRSPQL